MKKTIYSFAFLLFGLTAFAQNEAAKPINISTPDYVEFSPTVSGDGKTLIFQSNREGGFRLYECSRNADNSWSAPKAIDEINRFGKPNYFIGGPCLSYDGMTLYFCAMFDDSKTDMDIYVSKKNKSNSWSSPENIGKPITTVDSETFPSISPDGKSIYYTKTSVSGTGEKCSKVMMSRLSDKNDWMPPVELSGPINTTCDKSPRILYDNKSLIYANKANGHYDLFLTELNGENSWSAPIALNYINSEEGELYASISHFEDYIYYSKKGDIYSAPIPMEFKLRGKGLEGPFVDEETGKGITGVIYLVDTLSKDTISKVAVSNNYSLHVPATGKTYKVIAKADKYYPFTMDYTANVTDKFQKISVPLKLKFKKKEFVFNVSDKENSKGLKVKIKVTNVDTKEEMIVDAGSGRDGKYAVSLREGNKYNIEVTSLEGGYAFSTSIIDVPISSEVENLTINTENTSQSNISLPDLDIKLQPLKDKVQLTLKDIYFEFNQFKLSDSSFLELDRVVTLMKTNPTAKIEIAAHTDNIGSDIANNALSLKRASEIVKYLNSKGIPSSRLRPKGYGSSKPVDTSDTEEARAKNRRVELHILDIK